MSKKAKHTISADLILEARVEVLEVIELIGSAVALMREAYRDCDYNGNVKGACVVASDAADELNKAAHNLGECAVKVCKFIQEAQ